MPSRRCAQASRRSPPPTALTSCLVRPTRTRRVNAVVLLLRTRPRRVCASCLVRSARPLRRLCRASSSEHTSSRSVDCVVSKSNVHRRDKWQRGGRASPPTRTYSACSTSIRVEFVSVRPPFFCPACRVVPYYMSSGDDSSKSCVLWRSLLDKRCVCAVHACRACSLQDGQLRVGGKGGGGKGGGGGWGDMASSSEGLLVSRGRVERAGLRFSKASSPRWCHITHLLLLLISRPAQ